MNQVYKLLKIKYENFILKGLNWIINLYEGSKPEYNYFIQRAPKPLGFDHGIVHALQFKKRKRQ